MPARFEEPAAGLATVVLIATDWPADLERALAGLRAHAPAGTSVVIVADGPSEEQAEALEALEAGEGTAALPVEIVWTSERLGQARRHEHRHPSGRGAGRRSCSTRASSRPATS